MSVGGASVGGTALTHAAAAAAAAAAAVGPRVCNSSINSSSGGDVL